MSLARQSYLRKTAAVGATMAAESPTHANAYELQLIALADAKRALKQVQSIERKAEVKRRVLPQFADWVAGVLAGGNGGQDDVLMTCMVWHIDVGEYSAALDIAAYALQYGLILPDAYKRDVATLVAEEIADQALAALSAGKSIECLVIDTLTRAATLTATHDMPDAVRAKLLKAVGLCHLSKAELGSTTPSRLDAEQALHYLTRARELHDRVGVKKEIAQLQRALAL